MEIRELTKEIRDRSIEYAKIREFLAVHGHLDQVADAQCAAISQIVISSL